MTSRALALNPALIVGTPPLLAEEETQRCVRQLLAKKR